MDLDAPPGRIAVGFDNEQAGYDMTEALLASGKRHIVYFGAMSDARDNKRYRGYCRAMAAQGQTPRQIAPHRVSSVSIGADMLAMARERYPQLDGILCTNDDLAVGVLQALPASRRARAAGGCVIGISRPGYWPGDHAEHRQRDHAAL